MVQILHNLLNKTGLEEKMLQDKQQSIIIKFLKKENLAQCHYWRLNSLLCITSKIITRITENRMKDALDKILGENQAGLRSQKSCINYEATLRVILGQIEEKIKIYILIT